MASALSDLHVLDFSRVLAGPFATMLLADLGAEVTKVERPGGGDETRAWGPPYDDVGDATYFASVNRNKASVVLDLSDAEGQARARALALAADVVVENFRPGLMDELGLGYDELAAEAPGLVYCSITGFGRGGGAGLPGYDLLVQAVGGLMSITGTPGGEPQKVGVALVDVLAGLFASVGILTALRHRDATGAGQRVEVDLLSSLLAALVNQGAAFTAGGVVPTRMGNRHPSIAPYELVACADREVVLAVGNDRQFAALCDVLVAPELAADPRFATNPARVAHRDALLDALRPRLARRPASAWVEELTAARVPAGVVNDVADAFALAAGLGLAPVVELPRPDGTTVALTRNPIGLSATPPVYRTAPPALGQSPPRAADTGSNPAMAVDPTGADLKRFLQEDPGGPVVMLNLLRYAPGGQEGYEQYAEAISPHLAKVGAHVLYVGDCATALVAPDGHDWDAVLLVRYPSRQAFSAMVADPDYQQITHLRSTALSEAVLQATTPWNRADAAAGMPDR